MKSKLYRFLTGFLLLAALSVTSSSSFAQADDSTGSARLTGEGTRAAGSINKQIAVNPPAIWSISESGVFGPVGGQYSVCTGLGPQSPTSYCYDFNYYDNGTIRVWTIGASGWGPLPNEFSANSNNIPEGYLVVNGRAIGYFRSTHQAIGGNGGGG